MAEGTRAGTEEEYTRLRLYRKHEIIYENSALFDSKDCLSMAFGKERFVMRKRAGRMQEQHRLAAEGQKRKERDL